jgi:LytS/YehU family sensor histidine kinase
MRLQRESAVASARLRREMARTRERIVRLRLQPRILSAVLDSVALLAERDAALCEQAVSRAGDFLRALLRLTTDQDTRVDDDATLVSLYLDLMRIGYSECWVPALVVERGIAHCALPPGALLAVVATAIPTGAGVRGPLTLSVGARDGARRIAATLSASLTIPPDERSARLQQLAALRAELESLPQAPSGFSFSAAADRDVVVTLEAARRVPSVAGRGEAA